MAEKDLQDFYDIVKKEAEYQLSLLFKSCGSPIEKKFIGFFYSYFIKEGHFIKPVFLSSKGTTTIGNKNGTPICTEFYQVENGEGLQIEFTAEDVRNAVVCNEWYRIGFLYWGFEFYSSGLKYHVIPQYPVFDNTTIKFLDFGIFVYNSNGVEVGRFDIECDGHDWHSSKEQIKADNIRSRFLSKSSFHTIRYSGSEIFSMDYETILELENTIYKFIYKKESGHYCLRKY